MTETGFTPNDLEIPEDFKLKNIPPKEEEEKNPLKDTSLREAAEPSEKVEFKTSLKEQINFPIAADKLVHLARQIKAIKKEYYDQNLNPGAERRLELSEQYEEIKEARAFIIDNILHGEFLVEEYKQQYIDLIDAILAAINLEIKELADLNKEIDHDAQFEQNDQRILSHVPPNLDLDKNKVQMILRSVLNIYNDEKSEWEDVREGVQILQDRREGLQILRDFIQDSDNGSTRKLTNEQ